MLRKNRPTLWTSLQKGSYIIDLRNHYLYQGIDVGAGVIDQDYRGNVGVILFNFGDEDFEVKQGDRIAQFILERIHIPILVESKEPLPETIRGEGGFGSTGVTANVTANVSFQLWNSCYVGCSHDL